MWPIFPQSQAHGASVLLKLFTSNPQETSPTTRRGFAPAEIEPGVGTGSRFSRSVGRIQRRERRMKSFPTDQGDDRAATDGSAVQEVLGELTERSVRKPASPVAPEVQAPKKTGQISRDIYRD
jgi:hypothetical protein